MHVRPGCLLLLVLLVCCWVIELETRAVAPITIYDAASLGDDVSLLSVRYRSEIQDRIEAPALTSDILPFVDLAGTGSPCLPLDLSQTLPLFRTSADPCYVFMTIRC